MKILQFLLSLLIIVDFVDVLRADDEGLDIIAIKRPFCNAFTGCGKKRDPAYAGSYGNLQLPLPVYRALLRIATARSDAAAEEKLKQRLEAPEQLGLPRLPLF